MFLKLMYITNSVDVALIAEKYGVDRIWIDLETLGKQERQGHIDSVKSKHSINDIKKISPKFSILIFCNISDKYVEEIPSVCGRNTTSTPTFEN